MTRTPQTPKTSKAYADARFATLKEARALKIGDIIKAFYVDTEEPALLIVSATYCTAKEGSSSDINATPLEAFGSRTRDHFGPRSLNTDKWMRVAHGGDLIAMIVRHATQQEGLFQLAADLNK